MDASQWDARYADSPDLEWGAEPNRWVVQEMADVPAGRALDIGAGEGRNALWLAQQGWRVTAVDFSEVALAKGKALDQRLRDVQPRRDVGSSGGVEWVHADVLDLQPARASLDLVLVCYLHLVPEQRRTVVNRAAEALAPGGTLLVIGHDRTNLTDGVGGPQEPDILFTAEDVLADLHDRVESGALSVERAEAVRRPVETPEGERYAVDALVRLTRP